MYNTCYVYLLTGPKHVHHEYIQCSRVLTVVEYGTINDEDAVYIIKIMFSSCTDLFLYIIKLLLYR